MDSTIRIEILGSHFSYLIGGKSHFDFNFEGSRNTLTFQNPISIFFLVFKYHFDFDFDFDSNSEPNVLEYMAMLILVPIHYDSHSNSNHRPNTPSQFYFRVNQPPMQIRYWDSALILKMFICNQMESSCWYHHA